MVDGIINAFVGKPEGSALTLNGRSYHLTYVGGSGTSALNFTYTVAPGDNTADLTVSKILLHGAAIHDLAGNDAILPGGAVNPAGTLQIDTIAPTISAVTATPANGVEGVG